MKGKLRSWIPHRVAAWIILGATLAHPRTSVAAEWHGGGTDNLWSTAANWVNGLLPVDGAPLTFDGSLSLMPVNDLVDRKFSGITFDPTAGAFAISGAGITLGGATLNPVVTNGVTNNSGNLQRLDLPIALDAGLHSFSGGPGGLAFEQGLTREEGSIAAFSFAGGTITTTNANTNGILGGWATVGGNWAVVNANQQVGAYTGYTEVAGGGAIVSNPARNVRISVPGSTITMAAAGTTDINSLLFSADSVPQNVSISGGRTLRLGAMGGIYRSSGTVVGNALTIGLTTSVNEGSLTAGGADNTPGEIVLNANGTSSSSGSINVNSRITDNGTGAVRIIKTGTAASQLNNSNAYSGGTYVVQGRLQSIHVSSYGTGDVWVGSGGQAFLSGAGAYTNDFFLAGIGTPEASGYGAIRIGPAAALSSSSTVTLIGAARIASRSTDAPGAMIAARITGASDLEIGGYNDDQRGIVRLSNTNNDWAGNTIVSGAQTLRLGASEVIPHGPGKSNLVLNVSGDTSRLAVFALNGFNETVNGIERIGSAGSRGQIVNGGSITATLTVGANDASSTFDGVIQNVHPQDGGTGLLALTKIGAGTLTLLGTNLYSAPTTISGGTLQLGNGGGAGTLGLGPIVNHGVLAINRNNSINLLTTISGSGELWQQGSGTTTLFGISSYTGVTRVLNGTLQLAMANIVPNQSDLVLAGGTFATAGRNETMDMLALTANSKIDLGNGASVLQFSSSNIVAWNGVLTIDNWSGQRAGGGADQLLVGSDATGLTEDQLAAIQFAGFPSGARARANGEIVPAPSLLLGDFSQDGLLTTGDIHVMLSALLDLQRFQSDNNLSHAELLALGDFDDNGSIGNTDIQDLLNALAGGGNVSVVPEPSSILMMPGAALALVLLRRAKWWRWRQRSFH